MGDNYYYNNNNNNNEYLVYFEFAPPLRVSRSHPPSGVGGDDSGGVSRTPRVSLSLNLGIIMKLSHTAGAFTRRRCITEYSVKDDHIEMSCESLSFSRLVKLIQDRNYA